MYWYWGGNLMDNRAEDRVKEKGLIAGVSFLMLLALSAATIIRIFLVR
jgi:hypothetical protein